MPSDLNPSQTRVSSRKAEADPIYLTWSGSGPGVLLSANKSDAVQPISFSDLIRLVPPWAVRFPCWCTDLQNRSLHWPWSALRQSVKSVSQSVSVVTVIGSAPCWLCVFVWFTSGLHADQFLIHASGSLCWRRWHQSRRLLLIYACGIALICKKKKKSPARRSSSPFLHASRDTFAPFSTKSDVYAALMCLREQTGRDSGHSGFPLTLRQRTFVFRRALIFSFSPDEE